jgi:hypothetical protein
VCEIRLFKTVDFFLQIGKNGVKKDFLSILSQKNNKEEFDFLQKLINFMEKRKTPIERPPMLGFKQSEDTNQIQLKQN